MVDEVRRICWRGEFLKAAAIIEHTGVPIDVPVLTAISINWEALKENLVYELGRQYDCYEGSSINLDRYAALLERHNIPVPLTETGRPSIESDVLRELARIYTFLAPLHELQYSLSELRLNDLAVGHDGRNRCLLSAFRAKTGRNAPSTSKFVFGPATWIRSLIKPKPGWGLAYLDWIAQEWAIGAVLSGDQRMLEAYLSGDPYLAFAKQVGAVPPDGTKATHRLVRDLFKTVVLGVNYGMGEKSLAFRIGKTRMEARQLLDLYRWTYPQFWAWADGAVEHAMCRGYLDSVFGWRIHASSEYSNPRMLRNYCLQANGAEMLRAACCFAIQQGVRVCAPVHDAILIEAPESEKAEHVARAVEAMNKASRWVLDGFEVGIGGQEPRDWILYPNRFMDDRGITMWNTVCRFLPRSGGISAGFEPLHAQT